MRGQPEHWGTENQPASGGLCSEPPPEDSHTGTRASAEAYASGPKPPSFCVRFAASKEVPLLQKKKVEFPAQIPLPPCNEICAGKIHKRKRKKKKSPLSQKTLDK
jgi:hypothetical protein